MFLTADDIARLTKKVRPSAQRRALDKLGITYRPSAAGEPLVRLADLDGSPGKARNGGPHWDRICQ